MTTTSNEATSAGRITTPREGPLTVFVHIPRTAGTTFAAVLRDNFPNGVRSLGNAFRSSGGFDSRLLRRLDDAAVLTRNAQVLVGHVHFGIRDRLPSDARYITFLRNPVERTLSHYYSLVRLSRRKALPGDGSLNATLSAGDVIYDNLQTRMLCGEPEPFGKVGDRMLEQAKENLRSRFAAFGVVESFDESVVLLAHEIGLESILYLRQRFAARPRGHEVPAEMRAVAERFNQYDAELYRSALELFEQRVAEQGPEFHVDRAALRAARDGESSARPPDATPDELWTLLVRARADALRDRLDRTTRNATSPGELRALLDHVNVSVDELRKRLSEMPTTGPADPGRAAPSPRRRSPRKRAPNVSRVASLEAERDGVLRELEEIRSRIRSADESAGGSASPASEQLRAEAAQAESRVEALERRVVRARTKLEARTATEAAGSPPSADPSNGNGASR